MAKFNNLQDVKHFIYTETGKYSREFGLPYSINFSNRMRTCLGRCRQHNKLGVPIRLEFTYNLKYLGSFKDNEEKIINTVLHEIAHGIAGATHHHDRVWVQAAQRIGCDGQRLATGIKHTY